MSIIKHVTLQKIVAHDFRYDPRIYLYKKNGCASKQKVYIHTVKNSRLTVECRTPSVIPGQQLQFLALLFSDFFFLPPVISNSRERNGVCVNESKI